ncbi:MAG: 4Fe-4S binding protein, partial [Dehalococcoidales bacterium]|nr:4Fe-4S binding protein [Dehalococcoidales bacterium]
TKTKYNQVHITDARCKGCGFCVEFCPQHILLQTKETNAKGYRVVRVSEPEKCSGCGLCSKYCPEFAIWTDSGDKTPSKRG